MSSLSYILDDDDTSAAVKPSNSSINKKDPRSAPSLSSSASASQSHGTRHPYASSSTIPSIRSGLAPPLPPPHPSHIPPHPTSTSSAPSTGSIEHKRRSSFKKSSSSLSPSAMLIPGVSSNYASSATSSSSQPPDYRQQQHEHQQTDPMGYSGAPGPSSLSPSSMRRGSDRGEEMPIKLTPITGRVSRAKKGVPVHKCDSCKPPKTFTRAEHLRRHQLSHDKPQFPCVYAGCQKAFHRQDLLLRHQQKHETEGDRASGTNADSPRPSVSSSVGQAPTSPPYNQPMSPPEQQQHQGGGRYQGPRTPQPPPNPTTYPPTTYPPTSTPSEPAYSNLYQPAAPGDAAPTDPSYLAQDVSRGSGLAHPSSRQGGWSAPAPGFQQQYYPQQDYGYQNQMQQYQQYGAGAGGEIVMGAAAAAAGYGEMQSTAAAAVSQQGMKDKDRETHHIIHFPNAHQAHAAHQASSTVVSPPPPTPTAVSPTPKTESRRRGSGTRGVPTTHARRTSRARNSITTTTTSPAAPLSATTNDTNAILSGYTNPPPPASSQPVSRRRPATVNIPPSGSTNRLTVSADASGLRKNPRMGIRTTLAPAVTTVASANNWTPSPTSPIHQQAQQTHQAFNSIISSSTASPATPLISGAIDWGLNNYTYEYDNSAIAMTTPLNLLTTTGGTLMQTPQLVSFLPAGGGADIQHHHPGYIPSTSGVGAAPCVIPLTTTSETDSIPGSVATTQPGLLGAFLEKVALKLPFVHPTSLATVDEQHPQQQQGMSGSVEGGWSTLGKSGMGILGIGGGGSPGISRETDPLRGNMAAIAARLVIPGKEAKSTGDALHKRAMREVKSTPERSSLQVMQTIVLCEYYSRFRGSKTIVRTSSEEFEWVYRQLLTSPPPTPATTHPPAFSEWIAHESHRRLLSACFLLDIHASILLAQTPLTPTFLPHLFGNNALDQQSHASILPVPLSHPTAELWNCKTEHEWDSLVHNHGGFGDGNQYYHTLISEATVQTVPWPTSLTPEGAAEIASQSSYDGCLVEAAEALLLSSKLNCGMLERTSSATIQRHLLDPQLAQGRLSTVTTENGNIGMTLSSSASIESLRSASSMSSRNTVDEDSEDEFGSANGNGYGGRRGNGYGEGRDEVQGHEESEGWEGEEEEAEDMEVMMGQFNVFAERLGQEEQQQGNNTTLSSSLLFPRSPASQTYAALRATPLLSLLSVAGKTYLFGRKIGSAAAYGRHKMRVLAWVRSELVVYAAKMAAGVLVGMMDQGVWEGMGADVDGHDHGDSSSDDAMEDDEAGQEGQHEDDRGQGDGTTDPTHWIRHNISGYWHIYVCGLILWAYGRRFPTADTEHDDIEDEEDEDAIMGWVRGLASGSGMAGDRDASRDRRFSNAVVRLARTKLAAEDGGGLDRMVVDALGVLRGVEEAQGGDGWF